MGQNKTAMCTLKEKAFKKKQINKGPETKTCLACRKNSKTSVKHRG